MPITKFLRQIFLLVLVAVPSIVAIAQTPANRSVLADGEWFKLRIAAPGLYKISYEYLSSIGYPVASLRSDEVKVYGNSTGLLPFKNSIYRPDDLVQNAIIINDGGDGLFGPGDFLLFYSSGPHNWTFDPVSNIFVHKKHFYDDYGYYFLTRNQAEPVRAAALPEKTGTETHVITEFSDYAFYEKDAENLIKSGRTFYGEKFDYTLNYSFPFHFPDAVAGSYKITVSAAASSASKPSGFKVSNNGREIGTLQIPATFGIYDYANTARYTYSDPAASSENVSIGLKFNKAVEGAIGWLDYIAVNVRRKMIYRGDQLLFRITDRSATGIARYELSNAHDQVRIIEVTRPTHPAFVPSTFSNGTLTFKSGMDTLRQFVAFSGSNFPAPEFISKMGNQNLHGFEDIDMIILTHPDFLQQSNRLASLHRAEGLRVEVVLPDMVYNEFSSGARDITAIKDLMRMLYVKAGNDIGKRPKYLLLFGDGSYDNREKQGNTCKLLTYQSENSNDLAGSFVSDDYFGFLDAGESDSPTDKIDIGIGRLPVNTREEADNVVNKIEHYLSAGYEVDEPSPFGNWRNRTLFVADDLSGNPGSGIEDNHVDEADQLSRKVDSSQPSYLVDKIYLDAYRQISTPGGERYPQAAEAFRNKVQRGALIVNYTGHGGEVGLAHERVLDISTINAWTNYDALPLFVTATCEFSRFDDPARTSAGEYILLNPKGGGIALLTTTRVVYSSPNFLLNKAFYDYAFPDADGKSYTLGEITMMTKVVAAGTSSGHNHMNFSLLGDPALRLSYPKNNVVTDSVNGVVITGDLDTLKAFSTVTITGHIENRGRQLLNDFNGVLDVVIFDKADSLRTLGNDAPAYYSFALKNKIIYKGKTTVRDGRFTFSFIVPRDISFQYGLGTINYYAQDGTRDANGNHGIRIGGVSQVDLGDDQGPIIHLFMNDESFKPGDMTDESPIMLAKIADDIGINTTGNGIGHDILAILDENTENAIVLNDFYEGDLDTYKSGRVLYPFFHLAEGEHTLTVKAWDISNNSATATTRFVVFNASDLKVEELLNFPNPLVGETTFSFRHNQAGEDLFVSLDIYDMSGRMVKKITATINNEGYVSEDIKWDGTSDGGYNIERGMYVYRLSVKNAGGEEVSKTNRLMVLK